MKNKGKKFAGTLMCVAGAIMLITSAIEGNIGMVISGLCIMIVGFLYFVPDKQ